MGKARWVIVANMGPVENDRDAAISRALAATRAQWPQLRLDSTSFDLHLQRVGTHAELIERHGCDLALACACALGDQTALGLFERLHMTSLAGHVARLHMTPEQMEELRQVIRVKLFTGPSPRIRKYSGKGPLGGWLRVLALRLALDELRLRPSEEPCEPAVFDRLFTTSDSPERNATRSLSRETLQAALEASMSALSDRDKTILRLHYVDGLNIDAIAVIYQTSRSTVARWLTGIRAALQEEVRRRITVVGTPSMSEMRSLFTTLERDLKLSLSRVLPARPRR